MATATLRAIASVAALVSLAWACDDDSPVRGAGGAGSGATASAADGSTTVSTSTGMAGATGSSGTGAGGTGGTGGNGQATSGAGGAGGAAVDHVHPVELTIEAAFNMDPDDVSIIVNAADGALLMELRGAELPLVLDLRDGDLVSERGAELTSHRVAPGVERIQLGTEPFFEGCDLATMSVTVDVPAYDGAVLYTVLAALSLDVYASAPGPATIEVRGCIDDTVDVLVLASDDEGNIVAHAAVRDIPFVPEGAADAVADFVEDRATATVRIDGLDGATNLFASVGWQTLTKFADGSTLSLEPPSENTVQFERSVIDPGFGFHWLSVSVEDGPFDGPCTRSTLHRVGAPGIDLDFDARALRRPVTHPDGTWGWATEGTLGDTVVRVLRDGAPRWLLREHPAHPMWAVVAVELPGGDSATPTTDDIRHVDYDERDGYAEAVGSLDFDGTATTRVLHPGPCDR